MSVNKGIIVWKGDAGRPESNLSKSLIRGVTAAGALDTLATALANHTDCVIATKSFNTVTDTAAAAPDADANVDQRGIIYMKNSADGSIVKLELPAPKAADYSLESEGLRYTSVALAAIVSAVNTATGLTYVGLYGKVIGRS